MSRSQRLRRLEAAAPSNIPDADVGHYCRQCLGAGGFRRIVELTRARLASGTAGSSSGHCRRCGAVTFIGAVRDVRRGLGLDL
jgi:hypothetical protein